jgi:hypothetical protein
MAIFVKPSGSARTAIAYVTAGALIVVWTVIYWFYLRHHPEGLEDAAYYWVYGFFFTGLVLLTIGLALGRIGRSARHADLPPPPPGVVNVDPSVPRATSVVSGPTAIQVPAQVPARPVAMAIPTADQQPMLPPRS